VFGRELARRRALDDIKGDAARTVAAMVLKTIGGDGGPFADVTVADAAEVFREHGLSDGIPELQRLAVEKRGEP
jgi:hypothetical protein